MLLLRTDSPGLWRRVFATDTSGGMIGANNSRVEDTAMESVMESLFTYGTLRDPQVQSAVFGRVVQGVPDTLIGYRKSEIIVDGVIHAIAIADAAEALPGQLIEVTPEELVEIDRYEGEDYRRIQVRLRSGRMAWVYCE
jgi:gamma-glutamylcyclotransferase (GGCT)/AIG2-like uncharacterized protein YtfP